jgi:hypothetical protein
MPEGSGAGLDAGDLISVRMTAEDSIGSAEAIEFRRGEKALIRKDGVQSQATMPLAQNAPVALGPFRICRVKVQYVVIENAQDVDARKGGPHMAASRRPQKVNDQAAELARTFIQLRGRDRHGRASLRNQRNRPAG